MINDLLRAMAETLDATERVRVFGRAGPGQPGRKRRDPRPALADEQTATALVELRAALAIQPDTEIVNWRCAPDLHLELLGRDDLPLSVVGLLHPGWVRSKPDADLRLKDPMTVGAGTARRGIALSTTSPTATSSTIVGASRAERVTQAVEVAPIAVPEIPPQGPGRHRASRPR